MFFQGLIFLCYTFCKKNLFIFTRRIIFFIALLKMENKTPTTGLFKSIFALISAIVLMLVSATGYTQTSGIKAQNDSSTVLFLKSIQVENAAQLINTPQDEVLSLSNVAGTSLFYNSKQPVKGKDFVFDNHIDLAIFFNGSFQKQTIELKKPLNKRKWKILAGHSPATKELFLYKDNGGGDLYIADMKTVKRKCLKRLHKNINSKYDETMAATNQDGSEIYFISDRPGGIGGKDIWMSKRGEDNSWGEAINLGPAINTDRDEGFVWVSPNSDKIWFSSQGHKGMGGYDVFVSEKSGDQWRKPQNLGLPVNSAFNETSISLNADGVSGFLVSDRPGGYGGYDIYTVKFPDSKKEFALSDGTETPSVNHGTVPMKGVVFDNDTKEPLMSDIQVVENGAENILVNYTNNPENGKYLIFLSENTNSTAIFDADGYLPHFESISLANISPSIKLIRKDIGLQKLKIGERGIFKNILFEFGKDNLRPESVPELLRIVDLMERYPAMEMEVQGHCDHIGSKTYNQKLSEKRAGSVVRYLSASGVIKTRLIAVGKGEDLPVAPNVNPNGTDNPEGRMLNRRTEFLILKLN